MTTSIFVKIADIEPIELTFDNEADATKAAEMLLPTYNVVQEIASVTDSHGRTLRTRLDLVTCVLINSDEEENVTDTTRA